MPLDPPNPYRVENQFLLLQGIALLAAGVAVLWLARETNTPLIFTSTSASQGRFVLLATGGVLLVLLGIWEFARITRQLHADVGPEQPASLAPEIASHQHGTSESAQQLAEIVRKGALPAAKVNSDLTRLISALISHFIYAPLPLRDFVQTRVANLIATLALLLLFGITWYFSAQRAAQELAAALYLALGAALVLRTYAQSAVRPIALGPFGLVALLVVALLGTFLAPQLGDPWPTLPPQALTLVAAIMLATVATTELLGLISGLAQVDPPPPASTAYEQIALHIGADPNRLLLEIDRELRRHWSAGIPNRRYQWPPSMVTAEAALGTFVGSILEESQPVPPPTARAMTWARCLTSPRLTWLAALDGFGLMLTVLAVPLWLSVGRAVASGGAPDWVDAAIGVILFVVGSQALRQAHVLWGRMEFESTVLSIDFAGALARTCVVRVRSEVFAYRSGRPTSRLLTGLSGDSVAARAWALWLAEQAVRGVAAAASVPTSVSSSMASSASSSASDADAATAAMAPTAQHITTTPATYAARTAQAAATVLVATDPSRFATTSGSTSAVAPDPQSAMSAPADQAELQPKRQCARCGATVAIDANLCHGCGSPLPAAA